MFMKIIEYMDENKDRRRLAYEVQYRLGEKLTEIALTQRKDLITVSGGAAVNTIIIEAIHKKCREMGVKLLTNKYVPPGDGGISLGQVAIAGNIDY
jgi:hydrogenase maturation protein HypF